LKDFSDCDAARFSHFYRSAASLGAFARCTIGGQHRSDFWNLGVLTVFFRIRERFRVFVRHFTQ
jgi:hypothetical protein